MRRDEILLTIAMVACTVIGSCIGMSAHTTTSDELLTQCRQESLLKRCCQCTQAELGRCGR